MLLVATVDVDANSGPWTESVVLRSASILSQRFDPTISIYEPY